MKRIVAAVLLLFAVNVFACDKGCYPFNDSCACDAPTEKVEAAKPSDEKPRRGQVPEWQDGTVHAFISKPKPAPVIEIPDTVTNHKGDLVPVDKD